MAEKLIALVHGSGFAGTGHTDALRDAGVEVVGMVSRTGEVVRAVAAEMKIPFAGTDWDAALKQLQPHIVAIGTPGGAHYEPLLAAVESGCHIFCDKPLTAYAPQAKDVYQKAKAASIKTAFAASFCYQPHALLAKKLVAEGVLGEPREVECISHYNLNPLIPWGWSHSIALGGGRLSNNFTHKLSIVEHVLGAHTVRVNGEVRNDMRTAPEVDGVHDFRKRESFAPTGSDGKPREEVTWRPVDSEWSYTVMARLDTGIAKTPETVSATFKHGGMLPRKQDDYIAFYGSAGAIFINGAYAQGPLFVKRGRTADWEQIPVPNEITSAIPNIADDTQRNWTQLAREFVADIRGEGNSGYQTFKDGWVYQEVIDAVRRADGWLDVPEDA